MNQNLHNVARLAALLSMLVLGATIALRQYGHNDSRGYPVFLLKYRPSDIPCDSDVTRFIVVVITPDGRRLNEEPVSLAALGPRIHEIYAMRVEKVIFVAAEGDVEFAPVAQAIDIINSSTPDMRIVLLTPAMKRDPCLGQLPVPSREPLPLPVVRQRFPS